MTAKKFLPLFLLALPLAAESAVNIQRWKTAEGTQILLVERHENPIVDMQVSFKGAGSVFNPAGKSHVAEFAASLLTGGTKKLDEEAFHAKANDVAAAISSSSDKETASAGLRSLSKWRSLHRSVRLLNEAVTEPRFDPNVFARNQMQAVTALQQQETTPDYNAGRAFAKLAYPDHPYGNSANVTVDSIKSVTLNDIRAFHRSRYGKDNAVVAIVGDVSRRQADRLAKNALKGLPDKSGASLSMPPVAKQTARSINIPFAGEQAQIILGMPLIKRKDPDYYALVAGNYVLGGGGFDSRLMKVLRDSKGYTYGVNSSLSPTTEEGPFTVSFSTQKKNTQAALADAQTVIEQFIAEGPTEAELQQAKANIIGSFPLRFDSNAKLVGYLSLIGVHDLPSDYLEAYPQAVSQLTAAQVKEAWQRRVKFDDLHIVVVGAQ
ncbi:M16 family metallopeptidase [Neisseria chenwenguii]|uniref:Peptidase M16 n=1 Tax=Neisseria chenwenguii TaxID=1853278 RepID=A0A220S1G3_9NEIS|nr:pitrilysin family protein [Neisseria chenwenguii]ASK27319.1 peptidase M16 [Neisseria chenwenguii]ROV57005.1 insulinase family protein [Neisseria chenwenguii]